MAHAAHSKQYRPQLYVALVMLASAVLLTALVSVYLPKLSISSIKPVRSTPVAVEERSVEQPPTPAGMLALVNQERARVGVAPLREDARLNTSAQRKAEDMVAHGYGHVTSDGAEGYTWALAAAPECWYASENIDAAKSSQEAVQEWLASPSHASAIRDPKYSLSGLGVAKYQDYYFVSQHFCAT